MRLALRVALLGAAACTATTGGNLVDHPDVGPAGFHERHSRIAAEMERGGGKARGTRSDRSSP